VEQFFRRSRRSTNEGKLSSRIRSRVEQLKHEMAKQLVAVYEKQRKEKPLSIATSYLEALPYPPTKIDRNRKYTYRQKIRELEAHADKEAVALPSRSLKVGVHQELWVNWSRRGDFGFWRDGRAKEWRQQVG
jgi:hypothetical protein